MNKNDFFNLFQGLCSALGRNANAKQSDIWFQLCRDRGFSLSLVAKAIDNMIANTTRFPYPKDLIAECSRIQVRVAETERAEEKEEENAPWRALTDDGCPVSQIAAKVSAALRGSEDAREELGWNEESA